MKLAIVGCRDYDDYEHIKKIIQGFLEQENKSLKDLQCIISGGATGVDTQAERYADENNIEKKIYPVDWNKHGKRAEYIRNISIINSCDHCLVFWDYESSGTKITINLALQCQRKIKIINININKIYNKMINSNKLFNKLFEKRIHIFKKHKKRILKKLDKIENK